MSTLKKSELLNPAHVVLPLMLLALVLYHLTAIELVKFWITQGLSNSTYSHGLLLLAACAVLFYKSWVAWVSSFRLQLNALGIFLLTSTSLAWFLANVGHVQIVQQFCLLFLLVFILWSILGYRAARLLGPLVLVLILVLPVWEFLHVYLQRGTATAVNFLLNVTGIPSFLEGLFILIPAGTFEVAINCSGLRYFIVATTVGVLYAYVNHVALMTGIMCVTGVMLTALLSNTLRIYIVIVTGQLSNMQHSLVTDHVPLGWVVFGIGMLVFIFLANKFASATGDESSEIRSLSCGISAEQVRPAARARLTALLVTLCGVVIGPALAYHYQTLTADLPRGRLDVTEQIGPWRIDDAYVTTWHPQFHGPDLTTKKTYRGTDNEVVSVYLAYYNRQEQGKEAVYWGNRVYDDKKWSADAVRINTDRGVAPKLFDVQETRIRSPAGEEKIVWRWYYVSGNRTGSDYFAKVLNIWGTLKYDPNITVFAVATDLDRSYDKSIRALDRFVIEVLPSLERAIDNVEST